MKDRLSVITTIYFDMFAILGEGAVKLQPMPLPQGMTPSSTEIIASLNEHLIQVLQVTNRTLNTFINSFHELVFIFFIYLCFHEPELLFIYLFVYYVCFLAVYMQYNHNVSLFYFIKEVSLKEQLLEKMEKDLEMFKRKFSVILHQKVG